jgi:hypothetical protein
MTRGFWIAAGIVAASNLALLGGAAANRRGEPGAVLVLSERELELPPLAAENTALALRLRWTDPADVPIGRAGQPSAPVVQTARGAAWFDRSKLEEVGFDCRLPLNEENLARYRATPPRRVYAVLEHDGPAWQGFERALAAGEDARPRSRLVVVDAGLDRAALRARWPDRTRAVVVPATATLVVDTGPDGRLSLRGRVVAVHPSQLNVPRPLNQVLAPLQRRPSDPERARYRVTVRWGRRDPWIADVRE